MPKRGVKCPNGKKFYWESFVLLQVAVLAVVVVVYVVVYVVVISVAEIAAENTNVKMNNSHRFK